MPVNKEYDTSIKSAVARSVKAQRKPIKGAMAIINSECELTYFADISEALEGSLDSRGFKDAFIVLSVTMPSDAGGSECVYTLLYS